MNKAILLDLPSQIFTPRLILRVPQAGDGKSLLKAILDGYGDFIKWLNWPCIPPSLDEVEEDCRKHHAFFILRQDIRFLIIQRETQEIMGQCGYPPLQANWDIPSFGISYFLARQYRGKGYAVKAVNALTQYAFNHLKARKVEIKVDPENISSLKVPQALNFILEATQKGCRPRKDKTELAELYTYALFNTNSLPPLKVKAEQASLVKT